MGTPPPNPNIFQRLGGWAAGNARRAWRDAANAPRNVGAWASNKVYDMKRNHADHHTNFKAALNMIEDNSHQNDHELEQSLRKLQEHTGKMTKGAAFWQGQRFNDVLKKIYYIANPDAIHDPLNSEDKDKGLGPVRDHATSTKESARATLQMILDRHVTRGASQDVKNVLLSDDDAVVLGAVENLFNRTDMVQRNGNNNYARFRSWLQRLNKSGNKSFMEAEVNKMLERSLGEGLSNNSESGQVLKEMVSRRMLSFLDNQIAMHHLDDPEYKNLRDMHGGLVGANRAKVYDMAMRAVKEKCPCAKPHTSNVERDFQDLEVNPKSRITGYLLLMLKEEPDTAAYRHAHDQAVSIIKDMGEQIWALDDEHAALETERDALFNQRRDGQGSELTLYRNSSGTGFLTVDERYNQVLGRIGTLETRMGKMERRYAVEIDSTNKFFNGLTELAGNDSIADLVRYEVFNSVDEDEKVNSLRQWFALEPNFMKVSVEAQINGSAPVTGTVQMRIINKLKTEFNMIHAERDQKAARLNILNADRNRQETTINGLVDTYEPVMSQAKILDLAQAFKDIYRSNHRNSSAQELVNRLEQASLRHQRLDDLRSNLGQGLTAAEMTLINSSLTGDINRDNYQSLVNHLDSLQVKYKATPNSSHIVADLKEMTNLLREDREAYHQELNLFGKAIVTEAEKRGNMIDMNALLSNHFSGSSIELTQGKVSIKGTSGSSAEYNIDALKKDLNSVEHVNAQIQDIEVQLANQLDLDRIFDDLTLRRDELATAIPSLQANIMVDNLKDTGLLTENNYKEVVGTMFDDLGDFTLSSDDSGKAFVNALNSFIRFIAHYINQAFAPKEPEETASTSQSKSTTTPPENSSAGELNPAIA